MLQAGQPGQTDAVVPRNVGSQPSHVPIVGGCPLSDVAVLGVAPGEALAGGHLQDHRVAGTERVGAAVTRLGLAAADVAARGTQTQPVV